MLKDALSTIPDSDDDEGREEIIIKSKKQKKGKKKKKQETVIDEQQEDIEGRGFQKKKPYKIGKGGEYGNVIINPTKLKDGLLEVSNTDNEIIYQDRCDKSLYELLTKRFNPKIKYTSRTCNQFNNLNMLSKIKRSPRCKKSKLGGSIYYTSPEDMMERLKILSGSFTAGHTNVAMHNEAWNIIDKLLTTGAITKQQHNAYHNKYFKKNNY